MDHKRRRELTRDMDRYLSSRRGKRIDFKKLFRMPLEFKRKLPSFSKSKDTVDLKKDEKDYESHIKSKYESFIAAIKSAFQKQTSEEDYVHYDHVKETTKTSEAPKETPKPSFEFKPSSEKSWFKALIDVFKPSKEPDYSSYPNTETVELGVGEKGDVVEIKGDLKTISKIALNVMKSLPKEELEKFKKTSHFSEFKETLQKYDLIK